MGGTIVALDEGNEERWQNSVIFEFVPTQKKQRQITVQSQLKV